MASAMGSSLLPGPRDHRGRTYDGRARRSTGPHPGAARQYLRRTTPSSRPSAAPGASAGSSSGHLRQRLAGRIHGRPRLPVQKTGPPCIAASIGITPLRPPRPRGRGSIGRVVVVHPDVRAASRRTLGGSRSARRRSRPPACPPTVSRRTARPLCPGPWPIERRSLRGGGAGGGASDHARFPRFERASAGWKRCPGAHARHIDHGPPDMIRQGSDRRIRHDARAPRQGGDRGGPTTAHRHQALVGAAGEPELSAPAAATRPRSG
jgi:hypothetical protein